MTKNNELLESLFFENEEYDIYKTLKSSVYLSSSIFLETPEIKTKNSAITFLNDKKSAILFYNTKEKNNLKMAFFSKKNTNWEYILDIPFGNMKLEKILTMKNEKEKSEFLIVGLKNKKEKIFYIYSVENEDIKEIFSNTYNIMTLCDPDLNGNLKLITLSHIPTEAKKNKYKIKVDENIEKKFEKQKENNNNTENNRKINKNIFLIISIKKNEIKIEDCKAGINDPTFNINKIMEEKFDTNTLGSPCLFLSLEKSIITGENTKTTFILDFNKNSFKLKIPYISNFKNENMAPISFLDINKDKKLEFLFTKPFPGYYLKKKKKISSQQRPYITTFTNIEKNEKENSNFRILLDEKINEEYKNTYINFKHKYGIKLPERWNDKVTAKYKNDNQDIDFFIYKNSKKNDSQKLLTIEVCYNINDKEDKDFFTLKEKEKISYRAKIYKNLKITDPNLKLTEEELKKIFFMLD